MFEVLFKAAVRTTSTSTAWGVEAGACLSHAHAHAHAVLSAKLPKVTRHSLLPFPADDMFGSAPTCDVLQEQQRDLALATQLHKMSSLQGRL